MKKKNYRLLNYLGFVLLTLPFGVVAMDDDAFMDDVFGQGISGENDMRMSDLLSNESAFDMENEPPLSFDYDGPDLSKIPVYPEGHPLHPYSQHDESEDASPHSHAHSHSHSSSGNSGSSIPVAPNLMPTLIVQQQMQQPETQTMQKQSTHSSNSSSSASSSSAQPAVTGLALLAAHAIQIQMQGSEQQSTQKKSSAASAKSPATMSSASSGNSKKNKSKSKGSKSKKPEKVKSELFGQCAEDIIKTVKRSVEDKKAGVWTCEDSVCRKKISGSQSRFKDHLRTHTEEKPHKCSVCGTAFGQNSSLTKHMRIHTGEGFKCEKCKKKFTQKIDLKRHMNTHTGEKLDVCTGCGRGFTQHLKRHMRNCKAGQSSSSNSVSSSNSSAMTDEEDEDATMGDDEGDEMEASPSAPAGKIPIEHSGTKHQRNEDEDEDDSEHQPPASKKLRIKK